MYMISFSMRICDLCFILPSCSVYAPQRFSQGLRPEASWGPALEKFRLEAGYPVLEEEEHTSKPANKKMNGETYEMVPEKSSYTPNSETVWSYPSIQKVMSNFQATFIL